MPKATQIIRRRRNRKARHRATSTRNQIWFYVVFVLGAVTFFVPLAVYIGLIAILFTQAIDVMPTREESLELDPIIGQTQFFTRDEQALLLSVTDPLGDQRTYLTLEALPQHVVDATLQQEDTNYLETTIYDPGLMMNQLWNFAVYERPPERDTTITGRLVRNTLLPLAANSGIDLGVLEAVFTSETNRLYPPQQILEWYLNTAFYGNDAYGIEAAAQIYFGKPALDLSVDEAALLAPIPLAPQFNPFDDEDAARGRQLDLLRNMLRNHRINQTTFDSAIARLTPLRTDSIIQPEFAPDFAFYARQQAEDILTDLGLDGARMISRDGLKIVTTLDPVLYDQTECALRAHLAQLNGDNPATIPTRGGDVCAAAASYLPRIANVNTASPADDGTVIVMDTESGEILSMVGDALAARHQPGATLHPFVYLQGFLSGEYTPATMLLDIPRSFPGAQEGLIYTPQNPDRQFRGPINLRDAMASGLLPPAVEIADARRLSRVIELSHQLGLNSLTDNTIDLSLLERGGMASVLDVAYSYSVFAKMGVMQGVDTEPIARNYRPRNPFAVLRIEDNAGNVLWEYDTEQRRLSNTPILPAEVSFLINDILADNEIRTGTLNLTPEVFDIGRPAALTNSVTSDLLDNWTVGYTPQLITAVHLGRVDDAPMTLDVHGLQGAAALWQTVMSFTHDSLGLDPAVWPQPDDVSEFVVCERSGMNPPTNSECPTRNEYFLASVPPFLEDSYWRSYEINSQTGQLATANTPNNLRIESVFFEPPTAAQDWWVSNGLPLPPTEYDILSRPEVLQSVQLLLPIDFEYIGGAYDIRGTIDISQPVQSYQLLYGQGLNPTQWLEIGNARTEYSAGTSLGTWDTDLLDGIYTLQLAVTFDDNSRDQDFVQVTIDNTPPVISIQAGEPDRIYRFPDDATLSITADATDNLGIERVEFYNNGLLLGVDREWPYGFDFEIRREGNETFSATVFDQVGNSASAEVTIAIQRGN